MTLEPSPYTRSSSAEFLYPILYPVLNKFKLADLIFLYFWVAIPGFHSIDYNLQPIVQFRAKRYPILDSNSLIHIPYPRVNCPSQWHIPIIGHKWQYPPPLPPNEDQYYSRSMYSLPKHVLGFKRDLLCDLLSSFFSMVCFRQRLTWLERLVCSCWQRIYLSLIFV